MGIMKPLLIQMFIDKVYVYVFLFFFPPHRQHIKTLINNHLHRAAVCKVNMKSEFEHDEFLTESALQ